MYLGFSVFFCRNICVFVETLSGNVGAGAHQSDVAAESVLEPSSLQVSHDDNDNFTDINDHSPRTTDDDYTLSEQRTDDTQL